MEGDEILKASAFEQIARLPERPDSAQRRLAAIRRELTANDELLSLICSGSERWVAGHAFEDAAVDPHIISDHVGHRKNFGVAADSRTVK